MDILLSELIERTRNCSQSFEPNPGTICSYQMAWKALAAYFGEHDQALFSKPLAEQYLREAKAKMEAGVIKPWRYQLDRRAVHRLLEYFETGQVTWKYEKEPSIYLHQAAYLRLQADYLDHLQTEGKSTSTGQKNGGIARQFLEYLEQQAIQDIAQVGVKEISAFLPYISQRYRPASMPTVLTALRSFLRYVEARDLTPLRLSQALPTHRGRTTQLVPALTLEEEQRLLAAAEPLRATAVGKRNYAMLLLGLRLGLR